MKIKNLSSRIRWYSFQKFGIPKFIGERISKRYISKFLPKKPIIIDCGSHDGGDSVEWANTLNGAIIHAFEPSPKVYDRLVQNAKLYGNIKCYKLALSDVNGTAKFYVSDGTSDGSSSLLEPNEHLVDHPGVYFNEVIDVRTITLDDWALQNNIQQVDMLWLDMQGFEMQMLKSSKKILQNVKVIHTEVSVKDTYKGVALYPELRDWLKSIGFTIQLECIPQGFDMGNVLFVRK
ncbi:MAG: FkbM family methyltransferase [Flavipsychrobacter sp.]|nr:FkbM family methyltransferase [Flavipsychrobacter sp.]